MKPRNRTDTLRGIAHLCDYVTAAEFSNKCRKKGIQGGHIDFLICAVANRNRIPIFTNDKDYGLFFRLKKFYLNPDRLMKSEKFHDRVS